MTNEIKRVIINYSSSREIVMKHKSNVENYHRKNPRMRRQQEEGFFGQSFDYRNYVFSPEGFEGLALTVYLLAIPYLMGLGVLYLFVARTNFEYFVEFNLTSFFVIWAMGYEVCGLVIIAGIFIAWLNYSRKQHGKKEDKKRGSNNRYGY